MKKLLLFLVAGLTLSLTGCFEVTEEITLNEDGTGTYVNTNDMSKLVPVMKNMGMSDQLGGKNIDTSFAMGNSTDGLSEEEATVLKKGNMKFKMDIDKEEIVATMNFPFSKLSELPQINKVASKSILKSLMKQMQAGGGGASMPGMDQMPEPSSIGDYYQLEYENGELKRKLNKEKYSTLASDKYLEQMQQAGSMGIPVTYTVVINLPKPAEKLEGKNATLSDDKKKVTVKGSIDDLYDHPDNMEFKVKY